MIGWLRRLLPFLDRRTDVAGVIPSDPHHANVLDHADRLLANPKIKALESRGEAMRGSFVRADRRLAGR